MPLTPEEKQEVAQIVKDEMNARRLAQKKFRQADRRAQQRTKKVPGNTPMEETRK